MEICTKRVAQRTFENLRSRNRNAILEIMLRKPSGVNTEVDVSPRAWYSARAVYIGNDNGRSIICLSFLLWTFWGLISYQCQLMWMRGCLHAPSCLLATSHF